MWSRCKLRLGLHSIFAVRWCARGKSHSIHQPVWRLAAPTLSHAASTEQGTGVPSTRSCKSESLLLCLLLLLGLGLALALVAASACWVGVIVDEILVGIGTIVELSLPIVIWWLCSVVHVVVAALLMLLEWLSSPPPPSLSHSSLTQAGKNVSLPFSLLRVLSSMLLWVSRIPYLHANSSLQHYKYTDQNYRGIWYPKSGILKITILSNNNPNEINKIINSTLPLSHNIITT